MHTATMRMGHAGGMSDTPFQVDGLDAAAPQPQTDEDLQNLIDTQGKQGAVSGVRIVVNDDGTPAILFVVLTSKGEVTAIPSNPAGYLGPLAEFWIGKKATVVLSDENPSVASHLSISEDRITFGDD